MVLSPVMDSENGGLDEDLVSCKLGDIGVRQNERGQIEKHCNHCGRWICLGQSKGDTHAFREHYRSKTCDRAAKKNARILDRHTLLSESQITPAPSPHPYITAPRLSDEESSPTESESHLGQGSSSHLHNQAVNTSADTRPLLDGGTAESASPSPNSKFCSCFQCGKVVTISNMRQHVGGHILQSMWGVREGDLLAEVYFKHHVL